MLNASLRTEAKEQVGQLIAGDLAVRLRSNDGTSERQICPDNVQPNATIRPNSAQNQCCTSWPASRSKLHASAEISYAKRDCTRRISLGLQYFGLLGSSDGLAFDISFNRKKVLETARSCSDKHRGEVNRNCCNDIHVRTNTAP